MRISSRFVAAGALSFAALAGACRPAPTPRDSALPDEDATTVAVADVAPTVRSTVRATARPTQPPTQPAPTVVADAPIVVGNPTGPGSRQPSFGQGRDGRLYLAWVEPDPEGDDAVRVSAWDGAAWEPARTAHRGERIVSHWTGAPSVAALEDGTVAVTWLDVARGGGHGSDVLVAVSGDGGRSWGPPKRPHPPAGHAENGFGSLMAGPTGFTLLWLDGARGVGALRATDVRANGSVGETDTLDSLVCECCSVSASALSDEDAVVVFRDRSIDEVRDVAAVVRDADGWARPDLVSATGWTVAACPVNGPAVDGEGARAVAAWFTGPTDVGAQVSAAFSQDGGRSFGPAIDLGAYRPSGQVDAVLLEDGSAWVSALELGDLVVRRVSEADGVDLAPVALVDGVSLAAGRPRLARWGDTGVVAWAESGRDGGVRLGAWPLR